MAKPVTKWAAEAPSAAQIPFYLGKAYPEANTGRKGPGHLTIPVDLFLANTDARATVSAPLDAAAPHPGRRAAARTGGSGRGGQSPARGGGGASWRRGRNGCTRPVDWS